MSGSKSRDSQVLKSMAMRGGRVVPLEMAAEVCDTSSNTLV